MSTDYLPKRESGLLTWAENFVQLVGAGATEYGLTDLQSDAYGEAQTAFATAYAAANHPSTRTPQAIEAKNVAKRALIALSRDLVKICQAAPVMTDEKRVALGITVPDVEPTPVPVPDQSPQLDVMAVNGRRVSLRLRDSETGERKKPVGVAGAAVLSYVGETIPADIRDWTFEGNTTRANVDVVFAESVPMGVKVWLTAYWFNRRAQSGPACAPVSTHVGFGGLSQAA